MCGVVGILAREALGDKHISAVDKVLDVTAHRGPDDKSIWSSERVVLGHRRLSIIDVEGGQQPLFDEDHNVTLIYNGETYNYKELRNRLEKKYCFATQTDSEVLVHLYKDRGASFSDELDGMYAYAIWDSADEILHLGIDPFGIKPLYYFLNDEFFLFSSELRGIISALRELKINPKIRMDSVYEYLRNGWVSAPNTFLSGVNKLEPGQRIAIDSQLRIYASETQSITFSASESDPLDYDESVEYLSELISSSVKQQLVADVPVGILLSGGIDSSLLAMFASDQKKNISTFTVGFSGDGAEEKLADESAFARQVAERFSTTHFEHRMSADALLDNLDEAITAMDEPICDPAILPLFSISKQVSEHVKVVLSGDGGDELFAGYNRSLMLPFKNLLQKIPSRWRVPIVFLSNALPKSPEQKSFFGRFLRKLGVLMEMMLNPDYNLGPFSGANKNWIDYPKGKDYSKLTCPADYNKVFGFETRGQMAGQMLPKTDRISMWHGIEVRVPMLNKRIATFAHELDKGFKVKRFETKRILRDVAKRALPSSITKRRKHGFRLPISSWFRSELSGVIKSELDRDIYLFDEHLICRKKRIELLEEHQSGKREHAIRLWALFVLSKWIRDNDLDGCN